ncbi:MAG: CDP-alcohol phosphatidyltransferase family protein [Flavobacteriales bacterium]|nr:CDP-alcohol phosphatidyltransferase family protein [Flavobacteriales bacterium]
MPRLPDLLTTANLCCGVGSILLASQGQLTLACWLVFAGAAFDVLDGLAARALGGGSELGKQLDSLADMVTFGVAPAFIVWMFASSPIGILGTAILSRFIEPAPGEQQYLVGLAAMALCIASCWRLARFNVDTRQTGGFLGLPTPANGLFWVSLILGVSGVAVVEGPGHAGIMQVLDDLLANPAALFALAIAMAVLMLSSLPLASLKFMHYSWRGNEVIYLLLGIGAMLVVLYGMLAVPPILLLYLLSPLWGKLFSKTL